MKKRHTTWKKSSFYRLLRLLPGVYTSMRGVTVGATAFRLPLGVALRIEEAWMSKAIQSILPVAEGIFLDVGVNMGQTLLSLRSVDMHRPYVGFEPNVHCVSVARRIIDMNNFHQSTIIPAACSSQFGLTRLYHYLDSTYDSTASMVPNFRSSKDQRSESIILSAAVVPSLDAIGVKQVGIIKIDVEGFEADVLEALEAILSRDRPFVIVEVLPIYSITQRRQSAQRIMDLLRRLDFYPFEIVKGEKGELAGFRQVASVGEHHDVVHSDFLLSPLKSCPVSVSPVS